MRTSRLLPLCLFLLVPLPLSAQQRVLRIEQTDSGGPVSGKCTISEGVVSSSSGLNSPQAAPPTPMPGWPKTFTTQQYFHPSRGIVFADLDGDAKMEVIFSTATSRVYVWRANGTNFPGWPRSVSGCFVQYTPTVADLDGDGNKEILLSGRGMTRGGKAFILRSNGTNFPGWPKSLNNNNISNSMTAADLDGDGLLEVIVQERAYPIGKVHVFRYNGTKFPGKWPVTLDHVPTGTPAVGDIDGDGKPEIVFMSYNSLYVAHADGSLLKGFPYNVSSKHKANFSYQSAVLADFTGDGKREIVVCAHKNGSGCYVFKSDGTLLSGWPKRFGGRWSYSPPTVVDLNHDGKLDILAGRAGSSRTDYELYAWDFQGKNLPGFPVRSLGGAEGPITVADIDGDGGLEVFFDSNVMDKSKKGWFYCVDSKGKTKPGFPLRPMGFTYMNGSTIGDIDGDGILEVGTLSCNGTTGYISIWKLGSHKKGRIRWKCYHEGCARRGLFEESDRFAVTGYARRGSSLFLESQGPANSLGLVLLGLGIGRTPMGRAGILRLDLKRTFFVLHSTPLGVSGREYWTLKLPLSSAVVGASIPMQGVNIDRGVIKLNQMTPLVIR